MILLLALLVVFIPFLFTVFANRKYKTTQTIETQQIWYLNFNKGKMALFRFIEANLYTVFKKIQLQKTINLMFY